MTKHIVPLYADLIEGTDVDGQQLVADLHAFFDLAVPSQLAAPPFAARGASARKWHWPRTALVAALAVFALVGATYLVPLLQSLWSDDRGLHHVTQAGLARDLDLRQTVNGVTVHLQKGYADANRVAIGYSVEFPQTTPTTRAGDSMPLSIPNLTDDHGRTYPPLGFSMTSDSPFGAQVSSFEPPSMSAGDIALTLTIPDLTRAPFTPGTPQTFRGPWVFHFTLPMAAARVVESGPTFTRQGVDLTFTRIVVAPSATRFEYRVHLPGFKDRTSAGLVLSGLGLGSGRSTVGQVFVLRPEGWSGGPLCQLDGEGFECAYVLNEPLFEMDALHVDAMVSIPDREPCPPRQVCQVARDGKPFQIQFDGLVLPLR